MPSAALCFSIYPSTDFCVCQSQQKVFLRAAFLSPNSLHARLLIMQPLVLSLWRILSEVFTPVLLIPPPPEKHKYAASHWFDLICFHVRGPTELKITRPPICCASFSVRQRSI